MQPNMQLALIDDRGVEQLLWVLAGDHRQCRAPLVWVLVVLFRCIAWLIGALGLIELYRTHAHMFFAPWSSKVSFLYKVSLLWFCNLQYEKWLLKLYDLEMVSLYFSVTNSFSVSLYQFSSMNLSLCLKCIFLGFFLDKLRVRTERLLIFKSGGGLELLPRTFWQKT